VHEKRWMLVSVVKNPSSSGRASMGSRPPRRRSFFTSPTHHKNVILSGAYHRALCHAIYLWCAPLRMTFLW
jgi:hypothetical protein